MEHILKPKTEYGPLVALRSISVMLVVRKSDLNILIMASRMATTNTRVQCQSALYMPLLDLDEMANNVEDSNNWTISAVGLLMNNSP